MAGSAILTTNASRVMTKKPTTATNSAAQGLAVVTSRSHQEPASWRTLLGARKVTSHSTAGSSLKFGMIASGDADAYPRSGRTWEWDTAAGQAIVSAADQRRSE